jgi:hypothetical protein
MAAFNAQRHDPPNGAFWAALALAAFCVDAAGCGGGASSLTGQISVDGQPVQHGTIRLDPMEGTPGPSAAAPIQGGRYELARRQGVRAGKHSVLIVAAREKGVTGQRPATPAGVSRPKGEPDATGPADIVQYSATVEVSPGKNTKDFELGSRGPGS